MVGIHLVQKLISRSATFDFEGTSPMVINKLNAPRAISKSVIIYSLRCMVGYDILLNQGCLAPIHLQIPKWSILDPKDDAAVVSGHVLTSQRIVDVIMKAFKACAASQGCMHNTTFGDDSFGYFDTVAGGPEAVSSRFMNDVVRDVMITWRFCRDQPGTVAVGFTVT
ncbi:unnamed protein product [Clavelina lepadiformis]|uniref:Hydantoinase B/oxoprolinase domain-containing protein n=1 Tax=Clavelina lepadiformis TaxID=159417 RepID=A0ABP0G7Q3_CLALP